MKERRQWIQLREHWKTYNVSMYFCIHILKRAREHIHNFKIYYYKICATWKINFSTLNKLHLYVINMGEWGNMLWYLANDSWRFADDEEFNKKTNDNDLNLYYLVLLLFIQCEFVDLTFFNTKWYPYPYFVVLYFY